MEISSEDFTYIKKKAKYYTKSIQDADDLASIVFVTLLNYNKDVLKSKRNLIHLIMKTRAINMYDVSRKNNRNIPCAEFFADKDPAYNMQVEDIVDMEAMLNTLPAAQKECLSMRLKGEELKDISKKTGKTYVAVQTNIRHAVKGLKNKVQYSGVSVKSNWDLWRFSESV